MSTPRPRSTYSSKHSRKRQGLVFWIALSLFLVGGGVVAKWRPFALARYTGAPAPVPTPSPSLRLHKQYIYAGNRMVATDEPYPTAIGDAATFISQQVPSQMNAGQTYGVSLTFQNTGLSDWDTSNYQLISQNPTNNNTWGLSSVVLPADVFGTTLTGPGINHQAIFNFSVTAPAAAGTYNFQWGMAHNGGPFTAASTNISVTVAFSPKIVFTSWRDGNSQIYSMNSDGSNVVRLTNNTASDEYAKWSPDGTKIVFGSNRDGHYEIYLMNADGSNQTRLTNSTVQNHYPGWSPGGTKIAFASDRDGNREIYVMNADGSGQSRLTNNAATDSQPAWSPDGTKIVFQSNRDGVMQLYVMNADGSGQTLVPNSAGTQATWAAGPKIVFSTSRSGNSDVYVVNADGTGLINLSNNPASDGSAPTWSPDGTMIVFGSNRDGNDEIYSMNADGTNQTRLTNNSASDRYPSWQSLAAPPNQIVVVRDSFTAADGVELSQHVGELGASWAQPSYSHNSKDYIYSNRVTHEVTGYRNIYYASGQPQSSCYAQATFTLLGPATGAAVAGLVFRLDPESEDYYYASYDRSAGNWAIYSNLDGATTQLASWSEALTTGDVRTVRVEAAGGSLTLFINGTNRIAITNADHAAAGRVGVLMSGSTSSTTGLAISNFEAGTKPIP